MSILAITLTRDPHTAIVVEGLKKEGIDVVTFEVDRFPKSSGLVIRNDERGQFSASLGSKAKRARVDLTEVDAVWLRWTLWPILDNPGLDRQLKGEYRMIAQGEVDEALDGLCSLFQCPWINDLVSTRHMNNKIRQLEVARASGFVTPRTLVTNVPREAFGFFRRSNEKIAIKQMGRYFARRGRRIINIFTNLITDKNADLLASTRFAPSLLQEYVEKKFEVRATVVGDSVYAAAIYSQESAKSMVDWREGNPASTPCKVFDLPSDVTTRLLDLMKRANLSYAAMDLAVNLNDDYVLLDINPTGAWVGIEKLTGLPITAAFVDLLARKAGRRQG